MRFRRTSLVLLQLGHLIGLVFSDTGRMKTSARSSGRTSDNETHRWPWPCYLRDVHLSSSSPAHLDSADGVPTEGQALQKTKLRSSLLRTEKEEVRQADYKIMTRQGGPAGRSRSIMNRVSCSVLENLLRVDLYLSNKGRRHRITVAFVGEYRHATTNAERLENGLGDAER